MDDIRRYQLPDGAIIEGTTDQELVESMASEKFTSARSRAGYRRATARRIEMLHDIDVSPKTDESFIADLIKNGFLNPC